MEYQHENSMSAKLEHIRALRDPNILPHQEIVRIMTEKYPKSGCFGRGSRDPKDDGVITRSDIMKMMGVAGDRDLFHAWCEGSKESFTHYRQQQLSRILILVETGQMIRQKGGKYVTLPEPTKKADMVFKLQVDEFGKPTIVRARELPFPKQMPNLFKSFAFPGEKWPK